MTKLIYPNTNEMFTGLLDKNKIEVREGDLIRYDSLYHGQPRVSGIVRFWYGEWLVFSPVSLDKLSMVAEVRTVEVFMPYTLLYSAKAAELYGYNTARNFDGEVVAYTNMVQERKYGPWKKNYGWDDAKLVGYSDGNVVNYGIGFGRRNIIVWPCINTFTKPKPEFYYFNHTIRENKELYRMKTSSPVHGTEYGHWSKEKNQWNDGPTFVIQSPKSWTLISESEARRLFPKSFNS